LGIAGPSNFRAKVAVPAGLLPVTVADPEYTPWLVGPVGSGLIRVGAAPGSVPVGALVMTAGMSVAGCGRAVASPPRVRIAMLRSMIAGTTLKRGSGWVAEN
jgi:hypothetical protein